MTNIRTSGLQMICPDGEQAAETILTSMAVFKQCRDLTESSSLITKIDFDDMVTGTGVRFQMQRVYTDILTSGSVSKISTMFAGAPISYQAQVQKNAFSKKLDQLIEGDQYQEYPDRPGWEVLTMGDKPGQYVPTYSVLVSYFRDGNEDSFCDDWIPNAEIMSPEQGVMSAGAVYSRTLEIMALPIPGDINLTRVKRLRMIGEN